MKRKTVGMISLGCDKNRMDSERLLGFLQDEYEITNDIAQTQILIINTCAFLESARKESIETVFSCLPYKKNGKLEKIIMTGCLPQKFIGDIFEELSEVDGFLGTFDGSLLKQLITDIYAGFRVNYVGKGDALKCERYLTTPNHYAYLKIADGCNNHCTYCLIPKIRGCYKSEKIDDLIDEAKNLGEVKELILVAQDTTRYGVDIYGKPMIVGISAEADNDVKSYFTIKESQWPNAERTDNGNGFPWMEFSRLLTKDAVYGVNGRREVISVSVAQHSATSHFSATAWYGGNDRTRSWHNGANDTSEGAENYGYNFDEQFDFAIAQDTEMIFITGWNEWVAQRQSSTWIPGEPIMFVDCATPDCSRDIEPMSGGFGDNYYMQMAERIAEYKGSAKRVNVGRSLTIDVGGSFAQWESDEITAVYTDYANDTVSRSAQGFGSLQYIDRSGKNDFTVMKTARGKENIYFYAETADDIRLSEKEGRMTLFIGTGDDDSLSGFNYAVNLGSSDGSKAPLVRLSADGSSTVIGSVDMKVAEDQIMFAVPRSLIGCADGLVDISFKWADGFTVEDGKVDVMSFYTKGDAAPIGRFAYVFSEKKG